jgi:glycosyltransferase involved in cell wall biosynthesis
MTAKESDYPLKILFIDHLPFVGGAQLVLADHVKSLDRDKFTPFLAIDKDSPHEAIFGNSVEIFKINFSHLKRFSLNSLRNLHTSVLDLNAVIKKTKPDLIVSNTSRAFILLGLASFSGPRIAMIRDYEYPLWLFNLLKNRFNRLCFVSQTLRVHYDVQSQGLVVYVPSGMTEKIQKITPQEALAFRQKYGLKKEDVVIGFIGRLVEEKSPQTLLEALEKLKRADFKGLIVGTGQGQDRNIEERLRAEIIEKGLTESVIMTGFLENSALVYKSLDIFCLTTKGREPFATTLIESAQAQVPIIATDTGGTKEFITDSDNGLLYEPGSSDQLANQIIKVADNKSLRDKLVKKAFEKSQDFTVNKITAQLEDIYLQVK